MDSTPVPCFQCNGNTTFEPSENRSYCCDCDLPEYECNCHNGGLRAEEEDPDLYVIPPREAKPIDPGPPCHFCQHPLYFCICIVYDGKQRRSD